MYHLALLTLDNYKSIFKATTYLEYNILGLLLGRHLKQLFYEMNLPRLTEENNTNIYILSIKEIGGQ